ncbi:MAG: DinB family protein [Candidatus Acidiferrum sp.]
MNQGKPVLPEPWLRGTLTEMPAVPRAVLHALELAKEDLWKWCFPLSDQQLNERPGGIAPVAFHLRHIARSVGRLLTYAEGGALDETQLALLKSELDREAEHDALFAELQAALDQSASRIRQLASADQETPRAVGKKQLPTTIGGLLVHVADHTLRHVGQAITTAKLVAKH